MPKYGKPYKGYKMPNSSSGRSPQLEAMQRPVPKISEKQALSSRGREMGPYQENCDTGEKIGFGEYERSGN